MYGIDENVQETDRTPSLNFGIQENVFVKDVYVDSITPQGNPLLQITLEDEYGAQLNEIIWPVDEENERERAEQGNRTHSRDDQKHGFVEGEPVTPDDAVILAYRQFKQRVTHIAKRFVSKETLIEATEDAENYQEFAEAYASLFTESRISDRPMRVIVTANNKGYPKLPDYPAFIESMKVPKEKSQLEISNYDQRQIAQAQSSPEDQANDMDGFEDDASFDDEPTF